MNLLHFVAFFHVASLLSIGVDNEKVGVDSEKALELDNRIHIFLIFQPDLNIENHPKMQQNILLHNSMHDHAWLWLELEFLLSKTNYIFNYFKDFLEALNLLKNGPQIHNLTCSQLISSSNNKKILLTTRNVRLDSGHYATKYYCHFVIENLTNRDEFHNLKNQVCWSLL